MKSIILAAGYATRLYPLTENQPKPLLPVAGKPMLNYIMEKIEEVSDIDEVFVVTNNKFFLTFVQWKANNEDKFTKKITIVNDKTKTNEDRLGAIGDIHYVIDNMNIDEELLVIAGDNLFEFSLAKFVDFAQYKSPFALIRLIFGYLFFINFEVPSVEPSSTKKTSKLIFLIFLWLNNAFKHCLVFLSLL